MSSTCLVGWGVVVLVVSGRSGDGVASGEALSAGMRSFGLSASRGLNADSVRRAGGKLDPRHSDWSARRGWIGKVLADRYFSHVLSSFSEVQRAIGYVIGNAKRHYGVTAASGVPGVDAFCSLALVGPVARELPGRGGMVVAEPSKSLRRAMSFAQLGLVRG